MPQIDVRRSVEDARHDAAVNILGTINVLEAARRHGVRKVTYASSAAVYGNPTYLPVDEAHPVHPLSPYGASKHTVEHYLEIYRELYDLAYVVLRYSNVYGPRQNPNGDGGVIAIFTAKFYMATRLPSSATASRRATSFMWAMWLVPTCWP